MKKIIFVLSLAGLLNSCQSSQKITKDSVNNCPNPPQNNAIFNVEDEGDFYEKLQSLEILPTTDTITFQSRHYNFIFCRDDQTWTVDKGDYQANETLPETYEEAIVQLADPPYQTLEWKGETYQYRALLDPNPFPDFKVEPKQVILELIKPETETPQRQILYTLDEVKEKKAGIQLGIPDITANIIHNNHFYWAISPEQGEGNGGIATIASYDPKTDKITVIQPPKLAKQQINDLAITETDQEKIFWLATQTSGEGNPYLAGMGLVSYHANSKKIKAYNPRNSSLVGMIPHELFLEKDQLWVATGNGICQIQWQQIEAGNSWQCWQFNLQAKIPEQGLELYPSLLAQTPKITLNFSEEKEAETIKILWWSPQDYETQTGRYEIAYQPGFTVSLTDNGAISWSDFYHEAHQRQDWEALLYWPGKDWIWSGDRFIRPFDSVPLNRFGGGPIGISRWNLSEGKRSEIYAMRGHLDLIKLTKKLTEVEYYSAWVDDSLLQPFLTIIPVEKKQKTNPNPLKAIAKNLK